MTVRLTRVTTEGRTGLELAAAGGRWTQRRGRS